MQKSACLCFVVLQEKKPIQFKITFKHNNNKAYRPNAHLLDILMHYNINIIIILHILVPYNCYSCSNKIVILIICRNSVTRAFIKLNLGHSDMSM